MSRRDIVEDMQRESKYPRNVAKEDPVLSIPKPRKEERHVIKNSPQSAPRRKDEYSRTCTRVQYRPIQGKAVTFALNAPTNILAALMGKDP